MHDVLIVLLSAILADLSKSRLPPPIPKSQVVHVLVDASGIQITEELVTGAGERMTISVKARFDGKDYPVSGSPSADAIAYQRVDRNTIKGVGKKDGKVIMHETVVYDASECALRTHICACNPAVWAGLSPTRLTVWITKLIACRKDSNCMVSP